MSDSVRSHREQPTRLPSPWDSPDKNTGVGCHFLLQYMKVKSESEGAQSCLTLSDPMDCSLPGSSIHGIFQARVLEWGAIAFSECNCRHFLTGRYLLPTTAHGWVLMFSTLLLLHTCCGESKGLRLRGFIKEWLTQNFVFYAVWPEQTIWTLIQKKTQKSPSPLLRKFFSYSSVSTLERILRGWN